MKNGSWIALAALLLAVPVVSAADVVEFTSSTGHVWDLDLETYCVVDGTDDTYDDMGEFWVEEPGSLYGEFVDPAGTAEDLDEERGLVWSHVVPIGFYLTLEAYQLWYFPADGAYARQSVFLRNPEPNPLPFHTLNLGRMGAEDQTALLDTSTGDTDLTSADTWCITRDLAGQTPLAGFVWTDGSVSIINDPTLGEGSGPDETALLYLRWPEFVLEPDVLYGWHLFYFQAWDETQIRADMWSIVDDPIKAFLTGLSDEEIASTVNYDLSDMDLDGELSELFGGPDCDDTDPAIHTGADEVCDGVDNNCDGAVDLGLGDTYYQDLDADGYGDDGVTMMACEHPGDLWAAAGGDCDDADDDNHPGADEVCDDEDNDCDGDVDEDGICEDGGDGGGGDCQCRIVEGSSPGVVAVALLSIAALWRRRTP